MPRTPRPSTKPPDIASIDKEQRQYAAGATHSFENETIQAKKIWVAAAPGEYGFENEPVDDHQFGVMIQGYKAVLVGVDSTLISINALGHSVPFTASTTSVAYYIRPAQQSPGVDGPYFQIGAIDIPWTDGFFNHLSVKPAYALDDGYLLIADSGRDPSLNGALQRNGTKLMWNDGVSAVDLTATGAPTTADYLVGTSNGSLSAEIVVGTTPGGELGGTWGSPTVDSIHSGSAHSDYAALASTPGGELGGTYASPTVDELHASSYHPLTARCTSSQTVSNTTTLANSTQLTKTVVSGAAYILDAYIRWTENLTTEGIRFDFTGTSSINYAWTATDTGGTASHDLLTSSATVLIPSTGVANNSVRIMGSLVTSGTTFTFRFANETAGGVGSGTVQEVGSYFRLQRVA